MNIVIFGDKKDNQISKMLLKNLSGAYKINSFKDGKFISIGSGNDMINIAETSKLYELRLDNAILILKNNAKLNMIKFINRTSKVIVNAGNTKGIIKLNNHLANVLTCGYSGKDFITFSSKSENCGMISLQRSIKTEDTVIEPFEISFEKGENASDYEMLASCLTMILIGFIKENPANKNAKIYF